MMRWPDRRRLFRAEQGVDRRKKGIRGRAYATAWLNGASKMPNSRPMPPQSSVIAN